MRCLDMLSHADKQVHLLIQAIRVRTSPTQVETALMHVAELDGSVTDLRVAAIHSRNPLHTFLFNSCGVLLNANASALQAFAHSHAGKSFPWFPVANHLERGDWAICNHRTCTFAFGSACSRAHSVPSA